MSGAFRSIRDHSNMRFADSFTQDMDFWRQRVDKEDGRLTRQSSFTTDALAGLPRNPFRDSAGMLKGEGVSPRNAPDDRWVDVLSPNLAAYRAAVVPVTVATARPNAWHLGAQAPYHLAGGPLMTGSFSNPAARAMRGAERLRDPAEERVAAPKEYEKHLIIEAPHQRICASLRRGMPRSRLDARMYAASPG